jgi:hypothetical protein
LNSLSIDYGGQYASKDRALLVLLEMDVKRRTFAVRGQGSADLEAHHAVHSNSSELEALTGVPVLENQRISISHAHTRSRRMSRQCIEPLGCLEVCFSKSWIVKLLALRPILFAYWLSDNVSAVYEPPEPTSGRRRRSTPFPSYPFHRLRGRCAQRAVRNNHRVG